MNFRLNYLLWLWVLGLLRDHLWLGNHLLHWLLHHNRLLHYYRLLDYLPGIHNDRLDTVDLDLWGCPRHVKLLLHHLELRFVWSRPVHLKLARLPSCWLGLASNHPVLAVVCHRSSKILHPALEVLSSEKKLASRAVVGPSDDKRPLTIFIESEYSVAVYVHVKRKWVLLITQHVVPVPLDFVHRYLKLAEHRAGFVLALDHPIAHDPAVGESRASHVLLGKIHCAVLRNLAEQLVGSLLVLTASSQLAVQSYNQIVEGKRVVLVHETLEALPSNLLVLKCFIIVVVHLSRQILIYNLKVTISSLALEINFCSSWIQTWNYNKNQHEKKSGF